MCGWVGCVCLYVVSLSVRNICGRYDWSNRCVLRCDMVKHTCVFLPLVPNSCNELYLFGSKVKKMFGFDLPRISLACCVPMVVKEGVEFVCPILGIG